jgi:hypothetical protein
VPNKQGTYGTSYSSVHREQGKFGDFSYSTEVSGWMGLACQTIIGFMLIGAGGAEKAGAASSPPSKKVSADCRSALS